MAWLHNAVPVTHSQSNTAFTNLSNIVDLQSVFPSSQSSKIAEPSWSLWSIFYEYSTKRHHIRQARWRIYLDFHVPNNTYPSNPDPQFVHPEPSKEVLQQFKDLCNQLQASLQATLPESAFRVTFHKQWRPGIMSWNFCDFVVYYISHSK